LEIKDESGINKKIRSIVKGPQELIINLRSSNIGPEEVKHLANAIQSGKAPQGLNINLEDNNIGQ